VDKTLDLLSNAEASFTLYFGGCLFCFKPYKAVIFYVR